MSSISIEEVGFDIPDWDITKYNPSDVNHIITRLKVQGGKSGLLGVYTVEIEYCMEYNYTPIFSFKSEKMYLFDPGYKSYYFLAFLTDIAIKEFDTIFLNTKELYGTVMQTFNPPKVQDSFDRIMDALSSLP